MRSPLPWRQEDGVIYGADPHMDGEIVIAETETDGAALTEYDEDNAKFIVQACNAHDELVAALGAVEVFIEQYFVRRHTKQSTGVLGCVRAALAKTKGEQA